MPDLTFHLGKKTTGQTVGMKGERRKGGSGVCYFKLFVSYGLKLIGVLILPLPVTIAKWPWPGDLTCWSVSACYAGDVLAP